LNFKRSLVYHSSLNLSLWQNYYFSQAGRSGPFLSNAQESDVGTQISPNSALSLVAHWTISLWDHISVKVLRLYNLSIPMLISIPGNDGNDEFQCLWPWPTLSLYLPFVQRMKHSKCMVVLSTPDKYGQVTPKLDEEKMWLTLKLFFSHALPRLTAFPHLPLESLWSLLLPISSTLWRSPPNLFKDVCS